MRTTVRGLRRWLFEATYDADRVTKADRADARASILGVKKRDLPVKAGSKLAQKIEPDLIDMVTNAYASVGGNPKIQAPGDLSAEYPNWVVTDIDDEPDVDLFIAGQPQNGKTKIGASATDGSPEAKARMQQLKKQLLNNGWWGEVSDAPAHIALNKLKIKPVEDEKKVRALLGNKKITWHGAHPEGKFPGTYGWYSRMIGDTPHAKIIVGDV